METIATPWMWAGFFGFVAVATLIAASIAASLIWQRKPEELTHAVREA